MITISDKDVLTLNKARRILKRIKDDSRASFTKLWLSSDVEDGRGADGHDYGRLSEAATQAADSIFQTLNVARAYCRVPLTDDQIHDRPKGTA